MNERLQSLINQGIEIVNEIPKGWKILNNTTTAPVDYVWISNGKSLFSGERKRKLLKLGDI